MATCPRSSPPPPSQILGPCHRYHMHPDTKYFNDPLNKALKPRWQRELPITFTQKKRLAGISLATFVSGA